MPYMWIEWRLFKVRACKGGRSGQSFVPNGSRLKAAGQFRDVRLALVRLRERETGHVSATPAVHGSVANFAGAIAPLLERQVSHRQLIFGPTIGAFEDCHGSLRANGDDIQW